MNWLAIWLLAHLYGTPPRPPPPPLAEIHGVRLNGPDFEEARGKGCPLEAIVEESPEGGTLRFRCTVYGSGP